MPTETRDEFRCYYEVFVLEPDTSVYTYPDKHTDKAKAVRIARLSARSLLSPALGVGVYDRTNEREVFFVNTKKD